MTFFYAILASRKEDNDNIDNAILSQANDSTKISEKLIAYQITEFKPFDPVIKRTEATVTNSNSKQEAIESEQGRSTSYF